MATKRKTATNKKAKAMANAEECRLCEGKILWALCGERTIALDAQTQLGGNIILTIDNEAIVGAPGSGIYVSHLMECAKRREERKS